MNAEERLGSWKEIGAYLQRDARTARRWEKEEGLPVHRHSHKRRSSVYAYPSEIDAWRASRKAVPEPPPLWKTLLTPPRSLAFGATLALCLVMVGNGIRPQNASAQNQPNAPRQVWIAGFQRPNSLSSDGRYIAFSDSTTGDLGIHNLTTDVTRRLTDTGGWEASGESANSAVISADNRLVAYSWLMPKDQRTEIRVLPINGGSARTIHRIDGVQERMEPTGWTPDGRQLLVTHVMPDRTRQIAMLSVGDGSVRVLKSVGWQVDPLPRLSPDGRSIAYQAEAGDTRMNRDIFILASDGSGEAPAVEHPSDDADPLWAPDSARIFFTSNRTGNRSLWSVPVKDGRPAGPVELAKADADQPLGIAHGGTLYSLRPGRGKRNIYSAELDADGKVATAPALAIDRFIDSNMGPSLSPDGQHLAYYSSRPQMSLVIQTLKTGKERVVPTDRPLATNLGYGPMWFPDGRSVLVASPAPPRPGLYRVDLENGKADLVYVPQRPVETWMLSPDGRSIFFTEVTPGNAVSQNLTRLMRYDLDTDRATELKSGESFISPTVSPDGKQLAYVVDSGTSRYIAVMPAAGGESRELYRDSEWDGSSRYNTLAWTPDQSAVLLVRGGVAEESPNMLWRVPVAGGPATRLGFLMTGNLKSPQVQRDGKRMFIAAIERTSSEVWALENILPKPER